MLVPATDNHIHINPIKGMGAEYVGKLFKSCGGTALFVVSLPSWSYDVSVKNPLDFERCYSLTFSSIEKLSELGVQAFAIVGVHPAELTFMLSKGVPLNEAVELIQKGLERAAMWVSEQRAVAIGEVGLPHYPVGKEILEASNQLLEYALILAKDAGCPVQLHTGHLNEKEIASISEAAKKVGLKPDRIIKHFAPPNIEPLIKWGFFPSVLSTVKNVTRALSSGTCFLMETDFIDDPKRPGAVLDPRSTPRTIRRLLLKGASEAAFWKICKENPEKIYGVEIQVKNGVKL
ncbi:MAG: TatD family hydrolase [Candidatus Jordarchaeales archaeon]